MTVADIVVRVCAWVESGSKVAPSLIWRCGKSTFPLGGNGRAPSGETSDSFDLSSVFLIR